jgi:hypothetical protein
MGQLAIGGTLTLPKYDKLNNLIRDKDGEIIWEEKYFPPDQRALAHVLDRIDPQPNLEPQLPVLPEAAAEFTDAEAIEEAAKYFDLYRAGIQILVDLGVPLPQIKGPRNIETTATHPDEPAKPPTSRSGT